MTYSYGSFMIHNYTNAYRDATLHAVDVYYANYTFTWQYILIYLGYQHKWQYIHVGNIGKRLLYINT